MRTVCTQNAYIKVVDMPSNCVYGFVDDMRVMEKTMAMSSSEIAELEALIDTHTLAEILEQLAAICSEKADHLRSNWR